MNAKELAYYIEEHVNPCTNKEQFFLNMACIMLYNQAERIEELEREHDERL